MRNEFSCLRGGGGNRQRRREKNSQKSRKTRVGQSHRANKDESLIRKRMEVLNAKLVRSDGKTPGSKEENRNQPRLK